MNKSRVLITSSNPAGVATRRMIQLIFSRTWLARKGAIVDSGHAAFRPVPFRPPPCWTEKESRWIIKSAPAIFDNNRCCLLIIRQSRWIRSLGAAGVATTPNTRSLACVSCLGKVIEKRIEVEVNNTKKKFVQNDAIIGLRYVEAVSWLSGFGELNGFKMFYCQGFTR